jgi:hypothetical protein
LSAVLASFGDKLFASRFQLKQALFGGRRDNPLFERFEKLFYASLHVDERRLVRGMALTMTGGLVVPFLRELALAP